MSEVNIAHTPCKDCYFAEYNNNTQEGCSLELLDLYKSANHIEVIEAYDNEKEFFVINKKKCYGYKDEKYFKARNMETSKREERISYVKDLMHIKYLVCIDCKNKTPEELLVILEKIKNSNVKPHSIMVVTTRGQSENVLKSESYYKALNKSNIGCKWSVRILNDNRQEHIVTVHQVVNVGAERCNYVLSVGEDDTNVDKIINKANDVVFKDFSSFHVIGNESRDTIIFNTQLYKMGLFLNNDILTNYEKYTIV